MRSKPPWRVLFFGTDEFSLRTLQALNENSITASGTNHIVDTLHIVHPRTKKQTPVTKYAALCDLMGYEWPMPSLRKEHQYDVGVLASFGHLIPKRILEAFPYGILNVHPSLLPKWRGAAPLHHTILNDDKETGISIMALKPKHFDVGPLLMQKEIKVPQRSTFSSLREFLAPEGGKMILKVLENLPEAIVSETPQSDEGVTYAHKITQSMSIIDWENQTAETVDRQYRALHETMELRTEWEGLTVRLVEMVHPSLKPSDGTTLDPSSPPGLPVFDKYNDVLWVRCKDGWCGFRNIVIKKKMSAKSFYNGYLSKKYLHGVVFKSSPNGLFDDRYEKWIVQRRPS